MASGAQASRLSYLSGTAQTRSATTWRSPRLLIRRWVNGNGERIAYHDLVLSVTKSLSVEFAAARAVKDERRAQQLISGFGVVSAN